VLTAAAASACCLGPVVLSAFGAGAPGAAASRWEPYRPFFIGLTLLLLGAGFGFAHRPSGEACAPDGTCAPPSKRAMKIVWWIAAVLAVLLLAFPYYLGWLV
jgi:mercuric ion transport protein